MENRIATATVKAAASSASDPTEATLPTREVIGAELKQAREKAGLSREQARKLLGHHDKQFFYRWEGAKRRPDLQTAVQLCVAYRCSLDQLCPSLWRYYSQCVESRGAMLAEEAQNPAFRREVAHRTRKWETPLQAPRR